MEVSCIFLSTVVEVNNEKTERKPRREKANVKRRGKAKEWNHPEIPKVDLNNWNWSLPSGRI